MALVDVATKWSVPETSGGFLPFSTDPKQTCSADWPARNTSIGGPDTEFAYPYNIKGDIPYQNITLETPLHFGVLADAIEVGDVMDTESGLLCYTYE